MSAGIQAGGEDFGAEARVSLKLDSFLRQTVAFTPRVVARSSAHAPRELSPPALLTRHDVLLYVANKIGGVHFDPVPKGHLSAEKMHALGRMRRGFRIGIQNGMTTVSFNIDSLDEEQSTQFTYEPEVIDAVYLEFLAAIDLILASHEVQALRTAIAGDFGVQP
jgi:hypothetical protein